MNTVVVTPFAPDAVGGGADRMRGIIEGLSEAGHQVAIVQLPVRKTWRSRRDRPWWYFEPSADWIDRLAASINSADLLVGCYLPAAAACVLALRRTPSSLRFIYDADNDEALLASRISSQRRARYVARMEAVVIDRADFVWVAGDEDVSSLAERYPARRFVNVPNGVSDLSDLSGVRRLPQHAFTYGSWAYRPNIEGLTRLASASCDAGGAISVYGSIDRALSDRLIRIASHHQPAVVWRFAGYEPDLAKLAGTGAPAIIPLWSGAGTKLRTAQLTGMGVALVATPEAVAGLPSWLQRAVPLEGDPCQLIRRAFNGEVASAEQRRALRASVLDSLHWRAIVSQALTASSA